MQRARHPIWTAPPLNVSTPFTGDTMRDPRPNVLPLHDAPRQKHYRAAVAQTIRAIKAKHGLTNTDMAEDIGCCADTISNAENENNDLSAVTILRIGFFYGEDAIAPILELYRCRYEQPKTAIERFEDALAELSALRREIEA
jgi:DNA-binding XRE family transcriptional regulator